MSMNERFSLYDLINYLLSAIVILVVTIPILHVIAVSLEPEILAGQPGRFQILPQAVTFEAYIEALRRPGILKGLVNSGFVTAVSAALGTLITATFAYAVSCKTLPGRRFITLIAIGTMGFNLGIIPRYLLLKDLGMLNSLWALILPPVMWASNMVIMRAFFSGIPSSLRESALVDGADELTIFFRIILPLSMSIIATILLFYGVTRWNSYFDAVIFIDRPELKTIQVILREVLIENTGEDAFAQSRGQFGENLKMAIAVISILPIAILYPALQRYFVKGSLLGAVKG